MNLQSWEETMVDGTGKGVILAVDDTPENLDVVRGALGDDYIIKAAINGMIALKITQKSAPDLILLDIQMPGMDGFEVMSRLQAEENTSHIPVIFLTGESDNAVKQRARDLGAAGFVTKPIDIAALRDSVADVLSTGGV
jgi:putative two-component system response regulator